MPHDLNWQERFSFHFWKTTLILRWECYGEKDITSTSRYHKKLWQLIWSSTAVEVNACARSMIVDSAFFAFIFCCCRRFSEKDHCCAAWSSQLPAGTWAAWAGNKASVTCRTTWHARAWVRAHHRPAPGPDRARRPRDADPEATDGPPARAPTKASRDPIRSRPLSSRRHTWLGHLKLKLDISLRSALSWYDLWVHQLTKIFFFKKSDSCYQSIIFFSLDKSSLATSQMNMLLGSGCYSSSWESLQSISEERITDLLRFVKFSCLKVTRKLWKYGVGHVNPFELNSCIVKLDLIVH